MILNDPHNSHHNQGKENAYVGQECNAISYDNKVKTRQDVIKHFSNQNTNGGEKNLTLKRYKGKLYLTNEKTNVHAFHYQKIYKDSFRVNVIVSI